MREPRHAAAVVAAMTKAVRIPVTVKMRAGWNDANRNAPTLAKMVEDAGAAAVTVHGRTAEQSYSGSADWNLVVQVADALSIPVFGSGDCVTPEQVVEKLQSGVDGVLSVAVSFATPGFWRKPPTSWRVERHGRSLQERGAFSPHSASNCYCTRRLREPGLSSYRPRCCVLIPPLNIAAMTVGLSTN